MDFQTADTDSEFRGPAEDHLYGEISFDGMLEVLQSDYIRTAKAKASESVVVENDRTVGAVHDDKSIVK